MTPGHSVARRLATYVACGIACLAIAFFVGERYALGAMEMDKDTAFCVASMKHFREHPVPTPTPRVAESFHYTFAEAAAALPPASPLMPYDKLASAIVRFHGTNLTRPFESFYGAAIAIGNPYDEPNYMTFVAAEHEKANGSLFVSANDEYDGVSLPVWQIRVAGVAGPIAPDGRIRDDRFQDTGVYVTRCSGRCPKASVPVLAFSPKAGDRVTVIGFSKSRTVAYRHPAIVDHGLLYIYGDPITMWLYCPSCDHGDSGGGVYDQRGRLLGILSLGTSHTAADRFGAKRKLRVTVYRPVSELCDIIDHASSTLAEGIFDQCLNAPRVEAVLR